MMKKKYLLYLMNVLNHFHTHCMKSDYDERRPQDNFVMYAKTFFKMIPEETIETIFSKDGLNDKLETLFDVLKSKDIKHVLEQLWEYIDNAPEIKKHMPPYFTDLLKEDVSEIIDKIYLNIEGKIKNKELIMLEKILQNQSLKNAMLKTKNILENEENISMHEIKEMCSLKNKPLEGFAECYNQYFGQSIELRVSEDTVDIVLKNSNETTFSNETTLFNLICTLFLARISHINIKCEGKISIDTLIGMVPLLFTPFKLSIDYAESNLSLMDSQKKLEFVKRLLTEITSWYNSRSFVGAQESNLNEVIYLPSILYNALVSSTAEINKESKTSYKWCIDNNTFYLQNKKTPLLKKLKIILQEPILQEPKTCFKVPVTESKTCFKVPVTEYPKPLFPDLFHNNHEPKRTAPSSFGSSKPPVKEGLKTAKGEDLKTAKGFNSFLYTFDAKDKKK